MSKKLDTDTLRARLRDNPRLRLVEALPQRYFEDWHLPGALHLPHDEVRERAASLLPDRDAETIVYCASESCRNSHTAAALLEQLGYSDVAVYAGGKQAWQEAGLPVERGDSVAA